MATIKEVSSRTIIESVTLTLSFEEAQALMEVLSQVGGNPQESDRGLTDNIFNAIQKAGISYRHCEKAFSTKLGLYWRKRKEIEEDS